MAQFIPTGLGGLSSRPGTRAAGKSVSGEARKKDYERHELMPPPRQRLSLPAPDIMDQMIERALAAFGRGIIWDRGSIVNVVL